MQINSAFFELLFADKRSRWIIGLSTFVFLLIWLSPQLPYHFDEATFASYHIIFETIAIAVSFVIFSVCWHARLFKNKGDPAVLLFAAGFFVVAVFDLAHMLSYKGMPVWITPGEPNKAIHFWFAARYADAIAILLLVVGSAKLSGIKITVPVVVTLALLYIGVNFWLQFWHSDWLPVFFIEGSGLTTSKIAFEWGIIAIHLITLFLLAHKGQSDHEYDLKRLAIAVWLTILSELCFTLYSHVNDIFNFLGHLYKIGAYLFLYFAIVRGSISRPYTLLRESKELLQNITDNIHQVFWLANTDFSKMHYVNPAYDKIWGNSRQRLAKDPLSWVNTIHPADRKSVLSSLQQARSEETSVEFRIIHPDGQIRWLRNHYIPVYDDSGLLQHITGITEDITEQVNNTASLRNNEARLRAILKTASDGMHIVDKHGTLIDASSSFLQQLGYDENAIGNIKVWEWATDHNQEMVESTIAMLIASGETIHIEALFTHHKGHVFWADVYLRAFRIGDEELIYASARDISDRKQAEVERQQLQQQLFQAQKMESIGQLTGGIAHDFNNILNAIIGFTDLLKVELETNNEANTTEKRKIYIDNVLTAGLRAQELIAQMLIFSRTDKANDSTVAPIILLDTCIKEWLAMVRSLLPTTINVNYNNEDNQLQTRIQPIKLQQILLNLAINARDAIGEYGHININVSKKEAHTLCTSCFNQLQGEYIELAVTDSGSGIEEHNLAKIFEPFFTTKEIGKGTGMGLSVVHGLVHSLGGHLLISSEIGVGTTVRILLLENTAEQLTYKQEPHATLNTVPDSLKGCRVMVVDDEEMITLLYEELLTLEGAEVSAYNLPTDALSAFREAPHSVDIIITDMAMPELSGYDMAMEMLKLRPDLPILLCTGYSDRVTEEIAIKSGIRGFMAKPAPAAQLLQWVENQFTNCNR